MLDISFESLIRDYIKYHISINQSYLDRVENITPVIENGEQCYVVEFALFGSTGFEYDSTTLKNSQLITWMFSEIKDNSDDIERIERDLEDE